MAIWENGYIRRFQLLISVSLIVLSQINVEIKIVIMKAKMTVFQLDIRLVLNRLLIENYLTGYPFFPTALYNLCLLANNNSP